MARKPKAMSHVEAASIPVVAVTAWQMLFDYAQARPAKPYSFTEVQEM